MSLVEKAIEGENRKVTANVEVGGKGQETSVEVNMRRRERPECVFTSRD